MGRFNINEKGFWESESGIGHVHDQKLCSAITNFLKNENITSVFDFGCGLANYTKFFISNGIHSDAYDGNPNTPILTNGLAKVLDLSVPFNLGKTVDCVISLEVGEHIPKQYEQTFIDNLCNHSSKYILLSWAVVGQGGDGHVNCQNNDYIIDEMQKRGYAYMKDQSNIFRANVSNATWFINTLMLFKK